MPSEQWLAGADAKLLRIVEAGYAEAKRRAGDRLACRPGCGDCCHGMIPINRLDARRLALGVRLLEEQDPERAQRISDRARRAVALAAPDFPGDPDTGILRGAREERERFFARHAGVPCPALHPETRVCEIYEHRPVACRAAGPPVSFGGHPLPHCELCFIGADEAEVEASRVDVDPESYEISLLLDTGLQQTLIGYALLRGLDSRNPASQPAAATPRSSRRNQRREILVAGGQALRDSTQNGEDQA